MDKIKQYQREAYENAMYEAHRGGHHHLGKLLEEYLNELDAQE